MDDIFNEIQNSFLIEAEEFAIQSENIFLKIEKKLAIPDDYKALKRIFHNLKYTGKAVGFDHITIFCREIENLILVTPLDNYTAENIQLCIACNVQLKNEIEKLSTDLNDMGNFDLYIDLLKSAVKQAKPIVQNAQSINEEINQLAMPIITEVREDAIVALKKAGKDEKHNIDETIKVPLKKTIL